MKKMWSIMLAMVVIAIFATAGVPYAQVTLVKPQGGWNADLKFEKGEKSVYATIPTFNSQPNITGQTLGIFRSYAKTSDGKEYVMALGIDYKVSAERRLGSNSVKADLGLSNGSYRVRIWGEYANKQPMWINQSSIFCRKDKKGDIAYEALIDTSTGKAEPVPVDHPLWE